MKCPCCNQKITSFKYYCLALEKELHGWSGAIFKSILDLNNIGRAEEIRKMTGDHRRTGDAIYGINSTLRKYGLTIINTAWPKTAPGVYSIVPLEGAA